MIDETRMLTELTKFFDSDKQFESLDEIKELYNLPETDLITIQKIIQNRIDPIGWINENIKILHPRLGIIPFETYDFQENVIKLWLSKHFIITLKSRQTGLSTITEATCLWAALHYPNYNVLILSAKDDAAKEFLEDIQGMYSSIPDSELKLKTITDNEHTLEFENGSKILARPATEGSTRGLSINLMIIDEAATIAHIDDVYGAAYPVMSKAFPKKGEKDDKPFGIFIISTPRGISNRGEWFYKMYSGAVSGNNNYYPVRIHWSQVPEYDDDWYLDQCSQFNWDYKKIASELELSFVSSGNTFIPNAILDIIGITSPIDKDINGKLWIWEKPDENDNYIIGVDVAYGDKNDSSVIQVIKASNLSQVAEFEDNSITVPDFKDKVFQICNMYKNHIINIERNAVGKSLIDLMLKSPLSNNINFYRDVNPGDLRKKPGQLQSFRDNIGTNVTASNRDLLLSNMYQLVLQYYVEGLDNIVSADDNDSQSAREKFENIMNGKKLNGVQMKYGIIKSERLLHQLLQFVVDGKGKAAGPHDDLVMAWVHALYCYTKNKPMLLAGVLNKLNQAQELTMVSDTVKKEVEFMSKFAPNSPIWGNKENIENMKREMENDYIEQLKKQRNKQFNNGEEEETDESSSFLALRQIYGF